MQSPIVTGLSPSESPPGTRIKIRGENFGTKPMDLIGLTICGFDCLLSAEWKSPNKILAISGPVKGKGDVIVTTRYGGVGTCNVKFKSYFETIGPMKESAVWVEEAPLFLWGRHSLSTNSYQQEDPLGLSVEGNEKKLPEDDLFTYFPGRSGDLGMLNFSPGWFLLENHLTTSFNDLQAGLLHLQRKVEGQKEGQLSFLKANISSVVDQIDTLVNMRERCEIQKQMYIENDEDQITKLSKSIVSTEMEAGKLFDEVLARRDRAERTRNALNVFQRFRFLFCLPCAIDRNVKKGEYDVVINDYIRVKNLFQKTDVPLFKLALNEIEQRVNSLQRTMHETLQTMPITVEEQKRLIWHLNSLDLPYDYARDAIKSRYDYILCKLQDIHDFYKQVVTETDEGTAEIVNNNNSKSKISQCQSVIEQPPQVLYSSVPVRVLFVEEVSECMKDTVPDLWRFGQAYVTGELRCPVSMERHREFTKFTAAIIDHYCKMVRAAIVPHSLKDTKQNIQQFNSDYDYDEITTYLPDVLRYVRATYATAIKLELPDEMLDTLLQLLLDLRIHCMHVLFRQTIEQVKMLSETWRINVRRKYVGVTEIPLKFEQLIQDAIQIIQESVLSVEQRETGISETSIAYQELCKQVETVLMSFHRILSDLAQHDSCYEDDNQTTISVVSQLIGTPINGYKSSCDATKTITSPTNNMLANNNNNHPNNVTINNNNNHHESSTISNATPLMSTSWERRQLIILSNCIYTKTTLLDRLIGTFESTGYAAPLNIISSVRTQFQTLADGILENYVEQKSDPLVGTIEPSMYLGQFDWQTVNVPPTGIRPYVKECINNFIHVHSEVNGISTELVRSVLPPVVVTIAEEFFRLMACVKHFSQFGAQQARIDINVLQVFFQPYCTTKASHFFGEALKFIPKLEHSDAVIIQDMVNQCKIRMKIQLISLTGHR